MTIPYFNPLITSFGSVRLYAHHGITHMISIGQRGDMLPYTANFGKQPATLRLEFDDIWEKKIYEGHRMIDIDPKKTAFDWPNKEIVSKILNFAKEIKHIISEKTNVNLLAHCQAGISRSTAATFIVLCELSGPGNESKMIRYLSFIRPQAYPNEDMVSIADDLMSRNGEMVKSFKHYFKKFEI